MLHDYMVCYHVVHTRSLVGSTLISIRQTDVDRLIGRLALVTGKLLFCDANKVPLRIKKWRERCLRSPSSLFFTEAISRACTHIGKHYMVAHHIVVQHKLIEHCVQRLVSSTHFSKLLFSVLSTPRLSLVSFYVLLCT